MLPHTSVIKPLWLIVCVFVVNVLVNGCAGSAVVDTDNEAYEPPKPRLFYSEPESESVESAELEDSDSEAMDSEDSE